MEPIEIGLKNVRSLTLSGRVFNFDGYDYLVRVPLDQGNVLELVISREDIELDDEGHFPEWIVLKWEK